MIDYPENKVFPFGSGFHHIGCACDSLEESLSFYSDLGYSQESPIFFDETQGVRGCFINGAGPRLELLENMEARVTLSPWINSGIHFYHFAYFVDDMQQAIDWSRRSGGRIVVKPVEAIAFNGNLICFVMFKNGRLIEFINTKNNEKGV